MAKIISDIKKFVMDQLKSGVEQKKYKYSIFAMQGTPR